MLTAKDNLRAESRNQLCYFLLRTGMVYKVDVLLNMKIYIGIIFSRFFLPGKISYMGREQEQIKVWGYNVTARAQGKRFAFFRA